jgi:hypothetical protein
MGRPKKRQRTENETEEEFAAHDIALDESNDRAYLGLQQTGQISSSEGISSTWNSGVPGFDTNSFDTAFTPDGTLQPWMLPTNVVDWDVPMVDNHDSNGIPSLTPDTSSNNSPPILQFQQGLQDIPHPAQNIHHTHQPQPHPTTDPSLTGHPPTCACLSTLYLTLSTLATMSPSGSFPFPTSLHSLREAMSTASQAITCPVCPTLFITGLQNVQLLNALLMSLAERFSRILASISTEAKDLEIYNSNTSLSPHERKTKTFRMADLSTPGHMHSGGPGCAAAFELSFTPGEWRSMAKKVVRAEVHGPSSQDGQDGSSSSSECSSSRPPYLLGLITQMEKRQERMHRAPPSFDHPRDQTGNVMSRTFEMGSESRGGGGSGEQGVGEREHANGKGEHLCLKMLAGTRKMVDGLDWE